jgi:hypothetical protein
MSDDQFPPKVPCPGECAYGGCGSTSYGYACGGCCYCLGGCHLQYDVERAYIPETKLQAEGRHLWAGWEAQEL